MQSCGIQTQWIHLQITSPPKAQGPQWKKEQQECERQRVIEFAVKKCLLGTREATGIKSRCQNMNRTGT